MHINPICIQQLRGHPNILRLHAAAFAGPKGAETDGFLLVDHCPDTLLAAMQRANFALGERAVVEVASAVAAGVAHMHRQSPPLAHRDLKVCWCWRRRRRRVMRVANLPGLPAAALNNQPLPPPNAHISKTTPHRQQQNKLLNEQRNSAKAENVLMVAGGGWVICDFGSATPLRGRAAPLSPEEAAAEEDAIRRHTTPAYRAPEMWDLALHGGAPPGPKADIWVRRAPPPPPRLPCLALPLGG